VAPFLVGRKCQVEQERVATEPTRVRLAILANEGHFTRGVSSRVASFAAT
jgi:hypothetical protein